MKSLRELYRIGNGPSSSHTMGVAAAAKYFQEQYPEATSYKATLYGSLAMTGVGHCTDKILHETLAPRPLKITFDKTSATQRHPNTLDITAYKGKMVLGTDRFYSIGGGAIEVEGQERGKTSQPIYALSTFSDIRAYCIKNKKRVYDYVFETEKDNNILEHLNNVWQQMKNSVQQGLNASGMLPGPLKIKRVAKDLFNKQIANESPATYENRMVCAYAFAVAEENASGGVIVTAPTCGACGVLPATLYYSYKKHNFSDDLVVKALATAGLVGNIIKTNASISGAECGCQAEIGSACSMAAAAISELHGQSIDQIEYAAENAMEHFLGLTCDPIAGLVQIPCIERNAVAAMRALNASRLSWFLSGLRKISFDMVIDTMYQTGKDLNDCYRETSKGGLAKLYNVENKKIGKVR